MKALVSGVPAEGLEVLDSALKQAYGALGVEIYQPSKDSLEIEVRQAAGRADILLIVLDALSADLCKDSGKQTLSSDKFIKFLSMESFVPALRAYFPDIELEDPTKDLSLSVNEFNESSQPEVRNENLGVLEEINKTLQNRVLELEHLLEFGSEDEPLVPLRADNEEILRLQNEIQRLKSQGAQTSEKSFKLLESSDSFLSEEREKNALLESRLALLSSEREALSESFELEKRSLLKEIASLKASSKNEASKAVADISKEVENLKISLTKKTKEISSLEDEKTLLLEKIEEFDKKLESAGNALFEANQKVISLSSKEELARFRSSSPSAQEQEYSDLFNNFLSIQKDPLYEIGNTSYPQNLSSPSLLHPISASNLQFIAGGSLESHRLVYKFLRKELSNLVSGLPVISRSSLVRKLNPNKGILIVDLATESMIDYTFEINNPVSGLNWLFEGGELQEVVNQTALRGVEVLTFGTKFINDSSLMYVDWAKRLSELNQQGKNVVIIGDNLSSMVGRVLFENFRTVVPSSVIIEGLPTNVRNAVINSIGLVVTDTEALVVKPHPASKELMKHMESRFLQVTKVDV